MVTVPGMACDDARTLATEECQKPSADVIMSPSALTACPSDVELFGSGEYPDGETSVRPLIFKWEKYARSTNSTLELRLTFKKRLFTGKPSVPTHAIEFDLLFYQAVDDVRNDRFPVSPEEAAYLAALRAQVELGNRDALEVSTGDLYSSVIQKYLPKHLRTIVQPEDIAAHHARLANKADEECNQAFLRFVQGWPLYGSTVFEVLQTYTQALPKNLWLAINEHGFHILRRRSKEPIISYGYKSIVSYSPSLRNLMIVTGSLTRGTKFVFTTNQASQIAHLIKDYTYIILQRRKPSAARAARAQPPPQQQQPPPQQQQRAAPPRS